MPKEPSALAFSADHGTIKSDAAAFPTDQKAKVALVLALTLLCLSGIAAGFVIDRLYTAEAQVHHTYDVEVAIGDLESSLTTVGRSRAAYVDSATPEALRNFQNAVTNVGTALARMRNLTSDNLMQQALCDRLDANARQRIGISQESVDLKQRNPSDPVKQLQLNFAVARSAYDTAAISQQMRQNENSLLEQRSHLSKTLFDAILSILLISFILSALMFQFYYRLLNRELRERRNAESRLRKLSLQLMRLQDEEHRRFARELHDGLGQLLVGAKMMTDGLAVTHPDKALVGELSTVLSDAISQTRTISYLFHPPLLDEVGFTSAAQWLVDRYAQRTSLSVSVNISQFQERLPPSAELTLYRVLQEALNNIHRHSHSRKADVSVRIDSQWVTLDVRDYGRGIRSETLAAFQSNGAQSGVGLTGMKERVKEQGGQFEIRSGESGTEVIVKLPIRATLDSSNSTPDESALKIG